VTGEATTAPAISEADRWGRIWQGAQIGLVILLVALDFVHGLALGEHQVGFHPIYRLRQSLAVAISRMHEPPATGYLAYGSVVDALSQNGFAISQQDPGPQPASKARDDLFNNPVRMDHALQEAKDVIVDPKQPAQLILGNELAYADYVYDAFRLFGTRMSSLYYFYFSLAAISVFLFVLQFHRCSFCMTVAIFYLAELFLIENYARAYGAQLNTISNSRLFEALALLPAIHILLALWRRMKLTPIALLIISLQSALLAFVIVCRIAAIWQAAMIVFSALAVAIADGWTERKAGRQPWRASLVAWPAAIAVVALGMNMGAVSRGADPLYSAQPKYHIIWHEILLGILSQSQELRLEYLLNSESAPDQGAYDAVMKDLRARNDSSPSIAYLSDGMIYIDPGRSWSNYERLARSLVLRIVRDHPAEVLRSLGLRIGAQLSAYAEKNSLSPANLFWPLLIMIAGALIWASAEMRDPLSVSAIRRGGAAAFVVLAFAAVTPAIRPSPLSVGALMAYTAAFAILVATIARLGVGQLLHREARHPDR
jgi:hypothetical protein